MSKKVIVESFELDHTAVKAPYVRLISEEYGPKGDVITNFDIRLIQPNHNAMDTAGLHTIEHLLAKLIRQRMEGMIDCSPFGCRTGFHMIVWGQPTAEEIAALSAPAGGCDCGCDDCGSDCGDHNHEGGCGCGGCK